MKSPTSWATFPEGGFAYIATTHCLAFGQSK